jgi:tetratricopeptide (TPR) repeat protein
LLRHERAVFIGTVTEERPKGQYHFRVDERFKGAKEDYFAVEGLPFSGLVERFQVGKQYLVFATEWPYGKKDERVVVARWPTRELKYAQALLEQLRAEKGGKRNAPVYGTLLQTLGPRGGDNEVRPVAGAVVRIRSKEKSFETRTDERGVYAFERLPGGTFQLSTDLPSTLQIDSSERLDAFELPRRSCYERDISVVFSGKAIPVAESEFAAGMSEREKGKYPSALEHLQRAAALAPQMVEAHFALATVADGMCLPNAQPGPDMHKCGLAIQEYNRVLELDASHSDALKNLAYLLYQFNRLDESESLYRRALAVRADDPELLSAVAATNIHRVWPDLAAAKAGMSSTTQRPLIDSPSCKDVLDRNQARIEEGLTLLMRALPIRRNNLDLMFYLSAIHMERAEIQCGNRQAYEAEMNAAIEWNRMGMKAFRKKGWHDTFQKCPPPFPPMPGHPKPFRTAVRTSNP